MISVKSSKIIHNTVGWDLPPPRKNGCYTLQQCRRLGSIQKFLGWPCRHAQGGLALLAGVYLGSETVRCCLTQPDPCEGFTHFSVASIPHPLSLWALEHGSLFGGFSWQASMNVHIAEAACSFTRT